MVRPGQLRRWMDHHYPDREYDLFLVMGAREPVHRYEADTWNILAGNEWDWNFTGVIENESEVVSDI